jgi:hypothetical protein
VTLHDRFRHDVFAENRHAGRTIMKRFLKRHKDRIIGTISGFDRILFRGTLLSLCHQGGIDRFLSSQRVLCKDFGVFANRLTEGLKAHIEQYLEQQKRPLVYLPSAKESKEEVARKIMAQDQISEGLICVLTCVEPCQAFGLRRNRACKQLNVVLQERKCLHYYFYFLDREFGFMHVRLQSWLPMTIEVGLNGREYLARQLRLAGIEHEQVDNCFTRIANLPRAQTLLAQLEERKWERPLNAWARLLNPWQQRTAKPRLHSYYWTIRQAEYATDVMFKDQESLQEIYSPLFMHAIKHFSSEDVLRFLAQRPQPNFTAEVRTNLRRRVEGVRIKHWVAENSIKMYDKAGSVLRVETTINNPRRFSVWRRGRLRGKRVMRWMPLRKGIADIGRRVQLSLAANGRYFEALAVVGETRPAHKLLDGVSKRVAVAGRKYRPLHPIAPQESAVYTALLRGDYLLQGIRNEDLRQQLFTADEFDPVQRRRAAGRVTRLLRLLRAHKLIYKVLRTNYYRITKKGHEVMSTALYFRDTDLALLAT